MVARILAFRPSSVVERLAPGSHACPISTRELLGPAAELGLKLPVIGAPIGAVARGALVAAKELQSVLGLAMQSGASPEAWFDEVARAADEIAAGWPIFLSADVVVGDESAVEVERAFHQAWRLVDAGFTHLAIDVGAVARGERGRVVGEVAEAGVEHGICVDVVVPLSEGAQVGSRLAAVFEELAGHGAPADMASLLCPAPEDTSRARLQVETLARISEALPGAPVMRRGPVTRELLELLRDSPVRACDDGGAAAAQAVRAIPEVPVERRGDAGRGRGSALEYAASRLSSEDLERVEARAYVDALDFMERLGTGGSAPALARSLERRLEGG